MRSVLLPVLAVLGIMLANCGGSEPAAITASVVDPVTSAPAPAAGVPHVSGNRLSAGVARTYQQEWQRLHLLALEQKSRKNKSGGFFSGLLSTSNARNSSTRYRRGRNGNNISSLNGLFGRRKGRRR